MFGKCGHSAAIKKTSARNAGHLLRRHRHLRRSMFPGFAIKPRVGGDGKLHRLILTKKDRTGMVQLIDKIFGSTLEDKNASHIVSSAWVIKYGLTRPHYKAADEI
jgi:hypothetical protein